MRQLFYKRNKHQSYPNFQTFISQIKGRASEKTQKDIADNSKLLILFLFKYFACSTLSKKYTIVKFVIFFHFTALFSLLRK